MAAVSHTIYGSYLLALPYYFDVQSRLLSYAGFFGDDYVRIDWGAKARDVHNQVRAWHFMPFVPRGVRGPLAELEGTTVRVLRTRLEAGEGRRVECGDGPIWVLETEPFEG